MQHLILICLSISSSLVFASPAKFKVGDCVFAYDRGTTSTHFYMKITAVDQTKYTWLGCIKMPGKPCIWDTTHSMSTKIEELENEKRTDTGEPVQLHTIACSAIK